MLVSVGHLSDTLHSAEPQVCGIRADYEQLGKRDKEVFLLQANACAPLNWACVGGPFIEVRMFKLSAKYQYEMARHVLTQRASRKGEKQD